MTNMILEEKDFIRLQKYMKQNFGINLEKKHSLVQGRLVNVIIQQGYTSFHDYIEDAINDKTGQMINLLTTRLTTNYSYFMREDVHYDFMAKVALPEWTAKIRDRDLRVWSAGCSSGEEAYTAAMVINEYFGGKKNGWDTTILATDISDRVLNEAKQATYEEARLERMPKAWRQRYFTPAGGTMLKVKPEITNEVVFGKFNLMDPFTRFGKGFHIIFCRNVMIYFDKPTKTALAKKFCDVLQPGGYLFVGMSETLSGMDPRLVQVSSSTYKKV